MARKTKTEIQNLIKEWKKNPPIGMEIYSFSNQNLRRMVDALGLKERFSEQGAISYDFAGTPETVYMGYAECLDDYFKSSSILATPLKPLNKDELISIFLRRHFPEIVKVVNRFVNGEECLDYWLFSNNDISDDISEAERFLQEVTNFNEGVGRVWEFRKNPKRAKLFDSFSREEDQYPCELSIRSIDISDPGKLRDHTVDVICCKRVLELIQQYENTLSPPEKVQFLNEFFKEGLTHHEIFELYSAAQDDPLDAPLTA